MTNRTKSEFTSSHCRVAAKKNFLLLFPARFVHARYSSRMIDRFLNWGDHGKPKSGKIKGRCQPPPEEMFWTGSNLSISRCKRTREWALTFYSRTLLPRLLSRTTGAWPLLISLKWRTWLRFSLHRHHNGSVNYKRTHTPKSIIFVKCRQLL